MSSASKIQCRALPMLYDVTTITSLPGTTPQLLAKLGPALAAAGNLRGELLACWLSEIGILNRVMIIRVYPGMADLEADRVALTTAADPWGIAEFTVAVTMDTYAPFPSLPPLRAGQKYPFYEVRSYVLKPGGLRPTIESWQTALPKRSELSPLLIAMHTLTGSTPFFVHIWPYHDLLERQRIRARAVETGVWPPKGGPGRLLSQHTDIYIPAPFSPI